MIQSAFPRDVRLATLAAGDMVFVPLRNAHISTTTLGSAAVNNQGCVMAEDDFGVGNLIYLSVPAMPNATTYTGARVIVQFWGRKVGVRLQGARSNVGLSFVIDGVSYDPPDTNHDYATKGELWTGGAVDGFGCWLIDDALDDGEHYLEVCLAADAPGGASRSLYLYGILAEKRAGYPECPEPVEIYLPIKSLVADASVASSGAAMDNQSGTTKKPIAITDVWYVNTHTSDVYVKIWAPADGTYTPTVVQEFKLAAAGTDGSSKIVPMGRKSLNGGPNGGLRHTASVGSVVNAVAWGVSR